MKKRTYAKKRFAALLIAFAAAAGSILAPVHGAQTEAASKAYMKKAYVKKFTKMREKCGKLRKILLGNMGRDTR